MPTTQAGTFPPRLSRYPWPQVPVLPRFFYLAQSKRPARTHSPARGAQETANDRKIGKKAQGGRVASRGRLGGEGVRSPYLTSDRTQQGLQCGAQRGTDFYTALTPTGAAGHVGRRGPNWGVPAAGSLWRCPSPESRLGLLANQLPPWPPGPQLTSAGRAPSPRSLEAAAVRECPGDVISVCDRGIRPHGSEPPARPVFAHGTFALGARGPSGSGARLASFGHLCR